MRVHLFRRSSILQILAAVVMATVTFAVGLAIGRAGATQSPPAPSGARATLTQPAATAPPKPRVVVYGDSLVVQAEPYLAVVGRGLGLAVSPAAFDGTAPCDYLPTLRADLAANNADMVVWAFSGDRDTKCMLTADGRPLSGSALVAKYRSDIGAAISAASSRHVDFVLASPPAWGTAADIWEQLDTLYRELAAANPRIVYVDASAAIAPDGQFVSTQPCLPFEARIPMARDSCAQPSSAITVRSPDRVHFCPEPTGSACTTYSSGAMRYAINLLDAARLDLDYQAQVAAGHAPQA